MDGVFLAEAVIAAAPAVLRVACRPSDGVALALRCGARIRATDAVLAHAENAAEVLPTLPEHVRVLARTRMAASAGQPEMRRERNEAPSLSPGHEPLRNPETGPGSAFRLSIAPQKKTQCRIRGGAPAEEKNPDMASALTALKQYGKNGGDEAAPAKQLGNIRISLVRQSRSGNLEVVDEFCLPAKDAARPAADPLAEAERVLKSGGTEEERWAALLKVLSPETKLPM
jgi:hypothetical protein